MNTPNWVVTKAIPNRNYSLQVSFADGTEKQVDVSSLLEKAIYAPLKNVELFMKAKVECGTVVWNDDIDVAPEWLYELQ